MSLGKKLTTNILLIIQVKFVFVLESFRLQLSFIFATYELIFPKNQFPFCSALSVLHNEFFITS